MKKFTIPPLFIIAVVAVVNALGYGIVIPVLYSYSQRFGLTDFQNGLLFSIFSLCQFLATPIIGRLSDKYGRKPLLIISIAGTAVSFLTMALAQSAAFLFIARALDGITAGNIPVASAVISDTTEPKNRAKGFGIIGASFGFGFIFGPAISAFTLHLGVSVPFYIAAAVALGATILTAVALPETNKHIGVDVAKAKLIDLKSLYHALIDVHVGATLLLSLIYSMAFSLFIYGFQPYSVKVLHLSAIQISEIFTAIGIVGLITQVAFVQPIVKKFGDRKTLSIASALMTLTLMAFAFARHLPIFMLIAVVNALANSLIGPMIQTLLSKETDEKSQGSIMGLNASYQSIGMIVGPIIGGVAATYAIPLPFVLGSISIFIAFLLSLHILQKPLSERAKLHAMG
jgi:MFS family permease